ncbi:polysaccharide deacetylase family protein [Aphanizomenon flos-aquae NRERC-008]|uniref:Polysaccharide deacetylase family protein n=1 Tax=Aphanizomenon flos-aquae FACHB-1249 TaxID=2692889 RepID=A0ABR8IRD6_APHFL|nr:MULTISPECIES: polysaccharide deacetylase family protein [Aphanizomenon]MBD2390847.1 polysaccharide deacetylase family protein [Aphanizomenon flos-aquae FACHB-1171]MBD2556377.1 polysaccharide deacetylase family protein [Aphanizomenon flos-aquae FACHB-1290]MBD2631682.1 polysaccharide deacetylase family protein [Aphanizomenon sp. FACHB-1399]MBD2657548.1 polysaccharide deacetylase family protein [Aphanizomenon flos-aquae FACHB-1265]MBD2675898.1 polysaccharide deacetylase family protein [Aphaniz
MENNKSFFGTQGILIALVGLTGTLSIALMILFKNKTSDAQNQSISVEINNTSANVKTQQRLEELKTEMLTSWQQQAQAKGFSTDVPSNFQGIVISEAKLPPEKKVIALTFDDGPWPNTTAKVLDILKKNRIKSTFFVVGQNVKNYPDLTKQIVADGHIIANHTWHHWYHQMNAQAAAYEVANTTDIIYQTTGVKTSLFRPPGGIMNNGVAAYAKNNKYAVIMWSADSMDYSRPAVPRLMNNIFREAKPGGIVLMHDGGGDRSNTVKALPEIINRFRKQGYEFVTVPELLEMQDQHPQLTAKNKSKSPQLQKPKKP